jgi:hypothetical protein
MQPKKSKKQKKESKSSFKKHSQKHEPKKILFIAGLVFVLLVLAGCTEMTRAEKNLCYALASKSYAFIPNCETEQSCFEKVSELSNSKLNASEESELYELKNHVARSWFFYNKAVAEIKNVSNLCQQGSAGALPGAVNQTRFYMDQAFLELEQGMKKSFEIISLEEKYLSAQKIDFAKEEPLYDSLVELRQSISELSNGSTNSESYVSFYLNKVKEFNESGARFGLPKIIEKELFWLESYDYLEGATIKEFKLGKEAWVPAISTGIRNTLVYFENKFYSKQALSALEQFPAYEFMKLYSDIGGNNNSAIKMFFGLINKTGKNFEAASRNAQTLWKKAERGENACKEKLSNLKENSVFDELAKELIEATITNKANLQEECVLESKKLLELREKKSKGMLALGEELNELKSICNALEKNIEYLTLREEDYSDKLAQACNNKAGEIKKLNINTSDEQLIKVYNDVLFFASKTSSVKGTGKLKYCIEMVEKNKLLESGLKDLSSLLAKEKDSTKNCFAYLEKVFSYAELGELKEQFERLKKMEVTKDNLLFFDESCESIKMQADNELKSREDFQSAEKEFANAKEIVLKLEKINSYLDNEKTAEKIDSFKAKINDYSKYFTAAGFDFSLALPVKDMLSNSIHELWSDSQELLISAITAYSEKNSELIYLNKAPATTNQDLNSVMRLILPNPFEELNGPLSIKIRLAPGEIIRKDNCVDGIQNEKNGATIALNCLPIGSTTMDFVFKEKILTSEEDSFIFVSNKKSLLKRRITVQASGEIQKLLMKTKIPQNTSGITVIINGEEKGSVNEGGNVLFAVEKASKDTQITVFFYIDNVIIVTIMENEAKNSICNECLNYEIKAVNSLPKKLEATLVLDIPINEFVNKLRVFDEEMTQKEYSVIENKIVLKNQEFLEKQERNYSVKIIVDNALQYYLDELKKQKAQFSLLGNYTKANETENILLDKEKSMDSQALKKIVESNFVLLAAMEKENERQKNLGIMKEQLLEKIAGLRKKAEEYRAMGLEKEAKIIDGSTQKILESGNFSNESGLAKAFDTISKISFSADEELKTASEKMWKEIQNIVKETKSASLEPLVNDFSKQKEIIDEELTFDPAKAKEAFVQAKKDFNKILALSAQINSTKEAEAKNKIRKINSLCEENNKLIDFLEDELSPNESELVNAKFIPPITQSRLEKLRLMVSEIKNSVDELEVKEAKLLQINDELQKAVDSIKRQAISAFNSGIESNKPKEVLTKAKELIDGNDFVGAFLLLSSAKKDGNWVEQVPFTGLIPIICVVVIGFILRQNFRKKEKEEMDKKKFILDEWESK